MQLNEEQQEMLDGKKGVPKKKAMEILTKLGEIYGAEKMVPVTSVHMPGSSVVVAGHAGTKFVENMAAEKGFFSPFTTLNTGACDLSRQENTIGFPEDMVEMQKRLTGAYEKMGGCTLHSCVPYLNGNVPRKGEHIAWGESSAIIFANSVLGAYTNREGGPTALAAALTGCVPEYGLHLKENRRGQVLVDVKVLLTATEEFGALGYYVGEICEERIPVFTGIEKANLDQLKMLGAALASSGAVALYHIVGITPEAPTLEAAFGGLQPQQEVNYGEAEKKTAFAKLNRTGEDSIQIVALGCPHASINEIREVAELLAGRQVKDGVKLWVMTAFPIKALAERLGYVKTIEEAGGLMVCDTCIILAPMKTVIERDGLASLATNSAKLAHYAPGQWGFKVHYGSAAQCIEAAVNGRWNLK